MRLIVAALMTVALAAPAGAQALRLKQKAANQQQDALRKKKERETDQAYKNATQQIPEQQQKSDPWAKMR